MVIIEHEVGAYGTVEFVEFGTARWPITLTIGNPASSKFSPQNFEAFARK